MYYVIMGVIDKDDNVVPNDSAIDTFNTQQEALDCFNKMDRDFVKKFLENDLSFYETDKAFYKELQDEYGESIRNTVYPINILSERVMKKSFEEAFFIQRGYCYDGKEIKALILWLKAYDNKKLNPSASDITAIFRIDTPLIASLVLMFGDYGINPQHGWIEDIDGCVEYLESMRKYWEDKEND